MISRRNIRVKVMQTLYTQASSEGTPVPASYQKVLQSHFELTRSLLLYLTYFLGQIARFSEKNAHQRASKHLPTAEDLKVNIKIAGNKILWKIWEDESYKKAVSAIKPGQFLDEELVKKAYQKLCESPEYRQYISEESRENKHEKEILEFMLENLMLNDDDFINHIEELFSNWSDDGEMIVLLLDGFLKKTSHINFTQMLGDDKAEFARILLQTVVEKSEHLESLIVPKLKNWDPERIAQLDMILLKMGVAEFLYFETIPPKVTINEYIDLAKDYSTAQSGQFVNGILDNIHKELVQEGKMVKVDFRK
ncbi:MAG: transcription antitermination factor NusB [Chitinophagales bacterium]|nr:transcription antitermination factor NusB [Chitinophagales bacterium]